MRESRDHGRCRTPAAHCILVLAWVIIVTTLVVPAVAGSLSIQVSTEPSATTSTSLLAYQQLGMARMAEKNWDGLNATTDEGLALFPGDPELLCLKAYVLRKSGNFSGSADLVTIAIAKDPRPARFANRGFAYLALGRYQEALSDADAAISMNSSYSPSYAVKAIALMKLGNLSGADSVTEQGIGLDPSSPLFWQLKGRVSAATGNCTRATEEFQESLLINPDYDLPWPGFGNASADLEQATAACATPVPTPSPTRASFLPWVVVLAIIATGYRAGLR